MPDFVIVTDSSCDLSAKMAEELELHVLPLSFLLQEREYRNDLDGRSLSGKEFYARLRGGDSCTTSAVNVESFKSLIEPFLQEGKDVLCPCFSSGLSATYQAAQVACDELQPKYPERKVYAVDTLCASMGEGLILWYAARLRESGKSIGEVRDWLEENKLRICHWFTVDDLNFLKRGGRVSGATAFFGTMLNIKPVMHVDNEGHLIPMNKARGRKSALDSLVDHMEKAVTNPSEQTVFISHGDCLEDAEYVAAQIKERLHVKEVVLNMIGPVIGAHAGPGTVALFFVGSER